MTQTCVVAVCDSFDIARNAVQALEDVNFPPEQVSLVTHHVQELPLPEPAVGDDVQIERNAAAGAGFGGILGMLLGTPLISVSGIGAVLVAGPIAAGLVGAAIGGILGTMSSWGVHADHVRQLNEQLAAGAILVIANGTAAQADQAEQVLQQSEADDVRRYVAR